MENRVDFIVDALFYFESVQILEYKSDMFIFGFQLLCEQESFAVTGDDRFVALR